ncbi:MAG: phenylalanine--tRNA ligase beta subunit-related protein [Candidatus Krumholzibacteriota bacterium]
MNAGVSCLLPDGRRVAIAPEVADRLSCGLLVLEGVKVADNPAVGVATSELGVTLADKYQGLLPSEIPGLGEARTLYKSFGMDPSRHRPSSEALLRRVLKGKDLYRISNVVDSCNLASLEFLLPVGMYDLERVSGDIVLRTGTEREQYAGIRKGDVHLDGRLGLFDDIGPFGSPTSDSARTCTTAATRNILAVIMATAAYDRRAMEDHVTTFSDRFQTFCDARETFRAILQGESS